MTQKLLLLFIALLLACFQNTSAQGFEAPSDSNAVVYFVLIPEFSNANLYNFFHDDQFIGKFNGPNYIRYECAAGPNLFWVSRSNTYFVDCDLKPGGTYLIFVHITMVGLANKLAVIPIDEESKHFSRLFTFINENEALNMSQEKIAEWQLKFDEQGYISHTLKKFERKWATDPFFTKKITPKMAIPVSYLY